MCTESILAGQCRVMVCLLWTTNITLETVSLLVELECMLIILYKDRSYIFSRLGIGRYYVILGYS